MKHDLIAKSVEEVKKVLSNIEVKTDYSKNYVEFSSKTKLSEEQKEILHTALMSMICWRKGPFKILDTYVDSEWKSDLKWDRIKNSLKDMEGKIVADVGCGNGYYLYKLMEYNPKHAYGLDPFKMCSYQFDFLNLFAKEKRISFLEEGVDDLVKHKESFDCVMYLGVLYHRREPVESLVNVYDSLRTGGKAIIETLILPGEDINPIEIEGRYCQMHNIYYLTTANGFINWVKQAGFKNIKTISIEKTTIEEQRQTRYSPYKSLVDYLDPDDHNKTIEGYQAPTRMIIEAHKIA